MKYRKRKKLLSFCIFPGYRWCGPGCSGPGEPINDVDACCMRHDLCLGHGNHPCDCDEQLIECLRYRRNPQTQKGRNAELMYNFMKVKHSLSCGGKSRRIT